MAETIDGSNWRPDFDLIYTRTRFGADPEGNNLHQPSTQGLKS